MSEKKRVYFLSLIVSLVIIGVSAFILHFSIYNTILISITESIRYPRSTAMFVSFRIFIILACWLAVEFLLLHQKVIRKFIKKSGKYFSKVFILIVMLFVLNSCYKIVPNNIGRGGRSNGLEVDRAFGELGEYGGVHHIIVLGHIVFSFSLVVLSSIKYWRKSEQE